MPNSRMVRALGGLAIGMLVLGTGACSTVQDLVPFGDKGPNSLSDLEQAFEAIGAEASTDQLVVAQATDDGVFVTMVTETGDPEYLTWDFEDQEVTLSTDPNAEVAYASPDSTAAVGMSLADLDLEAIVERDPCEKELFSFRFNVWGPDEPHTYVLTECFDLGEATTAEVHAYLDGEPPEELDLSDPAALAQVVETAKEHTGQPPETGYVQLGLSGAGGMELFYTASTSTAVNLEGSPCQWHFYRSATLETPETGNVRMSCVDPEEGPFGPLQPFDTALYDPEVMANLWNSEIGEPGSHATVTLQKDNQGTLRYEVNNSSDISLFDPDGKPLD